MNIYGHVDQNVIVMDTTLAIGLRNYEHLLALVNSVFQPHRDGNAFQVEMKKQYGSGTTNRQMEQLEMFRFMHDNQPATLDSLISKLANSKTTFSTAIHLMAEPFGITYYATTTDTSLSKKELARCKENFKLFMGYVKQGFDQGIPPDGHRLAGWRQGAPFRTTPVSRIWVYHPCHYADFHP
jgi:hypothetical protein